MKYRKKLIGFRYADTNSYSDKLLPAINLQNFIST